MHGAEHGIDVQVQHLVEIIGISVHEIAADIGAGIGVEDVELAGLGQDRRHHGLDALRVQEIDDQRNGAFGVHLVADALERILGAVDEKDGGAVGHAGLGAGKTDAGCGAGDGNHFAGK